MENQQPRIPWFRLATMARQEADSAPQPTFPPVRTSVVPTPRVATPLAPQPPPTPTPLPRATPPLVPQPPPSPRVTPPLAPQRPPSPRVASPLAPPPTPQTLARPASPSIQQETPKQVVETNNGSSRPATPKSPTPKQVTETSNWSTRSAPSPPPSPKVIKSSSNPSPPPSPKVVGPPLLPPVFTGANNRLTNNTEPGMSRMNRLKSIAMQDVEDKKDHGSDYNGSNGKNDDGKKHNSNNSSNARGNPHSSERKENSRMNESRVNFAPLNHRKNEKDTKVVTLAGENVGAFMELGHSHGQNRKMHHGYSLTSELKTQEDQKGNEKSKNVGVKPITSLVNSNVQSINNSLIFNSSCKEGSPGVHLTFKRKSKGKSVKSGSSSSS